MSWLNSFFIAALTGVIAAAAGGLVAAGCVDWYRISGREGESAYFVVAIGLLSGIVGFFAGLILSRFVGGPEAVGFFKGLGVGVGAVLGVAGLAAGIAYSLADIPPTLNGHELDLAVEFRLPKGAAKPEADPEGKQFVFLSADNLWSHTSRRSEQGPLKVADARQENGRWIVPGSAYLFTTRSPRSVSIILDVKHGVGFQLEFPGHPEAKYQQWSEWLPGTIAGKPWPDTEMSYRFRVEERIPPPPPPDASVVAEAEFKALTPDSPLEKWISYLQYGMAENREQSILTVVESRPADLAMLLHSTNSADYDQAVYTVSRLKKVDPEIIQAMRDIATAIEDQIRKFNTMKPDQPGYYDLGNEIRNRFKSWSQAWWNVHRTAGIDGRPPLEDILQLARVQKESGHMQEVVGDAEAHLGGLTQATK